MDQSKERTLLTLDFSDLDKPAPLHPDELGRQIDELLASSERAMPAPPSTKREFFPEVRRLIAAFEPGTTPQTPPLPRAQRPKRLPTAVGVAPPANPHPDTLRTAPPSALPRVSRRPRQPTQVGVAPPANPQRAFPVLPPPPLPRHTS